MNIVHLSLKSLVMDGWNYQDNLLTKYHAKLGHKVTDITSHWIYDSKGQLAFDERNSYINGDGVKMVRLKMIGKEDYHRKLQKYQNLYQIIEENNPDILFIHSVSFSDISTVVKYLKKHRNVIAYADNHADFSNSGTNWLSHYVLHGIIWKNYTQSLIPYVKRFYGVTPSRVEFLEKIYGVPENIVSLLVMGADDELVKKANIRSQVESIRAKYNINKDDFLIITGGKIDYAKKQTILLMQAVNHIKNIHVKLLVFGSIDDRLKKEVYSQCNKQIQYIGWLNTEQMYNHIAASNLAVYPGRHSVIWEETAGIGIPMVCKYWQGTTHVDIGGNVLFLNEDSADAMENTLNEIINNQELYNKMKRMAQNRGMKEFSYMDIAKRSIE